MQEDKVRTGRFLLLRYSSSDISCLELLPRLAQRNAAPPEIRPGVPDLLEPGEDVPDSESIGSKAPLPELTPFQRDRDWSTRAGPHGVGGRHHLRVRVSIDVQEHAAAT